MKKSQLWYFDFIMGVTLFTLFVVLAFKFVTTDYFITVKNTDSVIEEAKTLSEMLVTQGIPPNWTSDKVISPGFTTRGNILNLSKLDSFRVIADNYYTSKNLLGLNSDYILFFEDKNSTPIDLVGQTYFGVAGYNVTNITTLDPSDIASITRYMVYQHDNVSEIIGMRVVLWQE